MQVDETPSAKRTKKQMNLLSHYPVATTSTSCDSHHEDSRSIKGCIKSIKTEMGKERPRDNLLKPLMKLTYITHRDSILGDPTTVAGVLETYLALKRPSVVGKLLMCFNQFFFQVEQEMTMILDKAEAKSSFIRK